MNVKNWVKVRLQVLLIVGIMTMVPLSANAETIGLTATVNILSNIELTNGVGMNFGTIEAPSTGEDVYDLLLTGEIKKDDLTSTGDGEASSSSTGSVGSFDLAATAGEQVTLSGLETSCDAGLSLSDFVFSGGTPHTQSSSVDPINHGATISIDSTVAEGLNTCAYDITALYLN